MTREVARVGPDEALVQAAHLMAEQRIKRLPVVDQTNHLVGILSRVDVLRTMGEDYHAPSDEAAGDRPVHLVGDLMRQDVPSVAANAPLGEVLDAVTSTRLNRAVVVDAERRVIGVVTDADLLAQLDPGGQTGLLDTLMGRGHYSGQSRATAREVMRTPPVTVVADTPVAEAAQRMLEARRKVLPITDAEGRLLGVIDRADLLGHVHELGESADNA
jgi:CBS domain-containing protein